MDKKNCISVRIKKNAKGHADDVGGHIHSVLQFL